MDCGYYPGLRECELHVACVGWRRLKWKSLRVPLGVGIGKAESAGACPAEVEGRTTAGYHHCEAGIPRRRGSAAADRERSEDGFPACRWYSQVRAPGCRPPRNIPWRQPPEPERAATVGRAPRRLDCTEEPGSGKTSREETITASAD